MVAIFIQEEMRRVIILMVKETHLMPVIMIAMVVIQRGFLISRDKEITNKTTLGKVRTINNFSGPITFSRRTSSSKINSERGLGVCNNSSSLERSNLAWDSNSSSNLNKT